MRFRMLAVLVVLCTILVAFAGGCTQERNANSEAGMHVNWALIIGGVVFGILLLVTLLTSIFTTQQQTVKIIERFGKFRKISHAGLCGKAPWGVDKVADVLSLKIIEISESIGVKSKDNAFLEVPVKIQVRVVKGKEREASYELRDPFKQMLSYVVNIIRARANDLTMDEIFQSKDEFETAVTAGLKERFEKYGYQIVNVLVDDPQPSTKLREEFDEVLASKRRREAAINDAEATRTRLVGEASANGESLEIAANAYVKQRDIIALGIVAAAKKLEDIPELSAERIFSFLEGIDWRDAIRDASKGPGSTIVVPMDFGQNGHYGEMAAMTRAMQPKNGTPTEEVSATK